MPHVYPARDRWIVPAFTTTVNTDVQVGVLAVEDYRSVTMILKAAANNLMVTVLGSVDAGANYDATVQAAVAVNVGTPLVVAPSAYYTHLKVLVRPAVANAHGTLDTRAAAIGA